MNNFRTIGVLGGIGPVATQYFLKTLLSQAHKKYGAVQDWEYPHIILNSLAVNGTTESGVINEMTVLKQLLEGIELLNNAGAKIIAVPCVSVHAYINDLRKQSKAQILSMLEVFEEELKENKPRKVAVFSSLSSHKQKLLYKNFKKLGIKHIDLNEEAHDLIKNLILDVMQGKTNGTSKSKVIKRINNMKNKNVDAALLGCTELPVAIHQNDCDIKIYDCIELLARKTLESAFRRNSSNA